MSKLERVLLLSSVILIVLLVGLRYQSNSKEASVASMFYEDHYYKVLTGAYGENIDKFFERQESDGLSVPLESLRIFRRQEMDEALDSLDCDLEESQLIIYPEKDFGPKDYTYEIKCIKP